MDAGQRPEVVAVVVVVVIPGIRKKSKKTRGHENVIGPTEINSKMVTGGKR